MARKRKALEMVTDSCSASSPQLKNGTKRAATTAIAAITESMTGKTANLSDETLYISIGTTNLDMKMGIAPLEAAVARQAMHDQTIAHFVPPQRRSARIQSISSKQEEEQRARFSSDIVISKPRKKARKEESTDLSEKATDCDQAKEEKEDSEEKEEDEEEQKEEEEGASIEITKAENAKKTNPKLKELPASENAVFSDACAVAVTDDHEAGKKVKETLRLFNTYYLRFVQVSH